MGRISSSLRGIARQLIETPLAAPFYYTTEGWQALRCMTLGKPRISDADRCNVEQNVTFIFKSFNRQRKAVRLVRSIKAYYPGAKIVIADDSEVSLDVGGAHVIHLPFNSGLSRGLVATLDLVRTPYVMRLDDDLVLTPRSRVHEQLAFLQAHSEVDLCGIQVCMAPLLVGPEREAKRYDRVRMGRPLLVPAGTRLDGRVVVGKSPNCFLARTESVRAVGWDPNIRMIDHHEFFWRAAGKIVCVQDPHAYAYHCHNRFDWKYRSFRNDWKGDALYIRRKRREGSA